MVTLRTFKHESRYQRMAHEGETVLVTHRGKPYFIATRPTRARSFVGAAQAGRPLTSAMFDSVLPEDDWTAGR